MKGTTQATGRGRKTDAKGRPQSQIQPLTHDRLQQQQLSFEPVQRAQRVTEVVDDQQVGHLPLPQPLGGDVSELQEQVDDLDESWETESIFQDIIEDLTHDEFPPDVDACTTEQAVAYRQQLRAVGPNQFCRMHLDSGSITVKKLLTAFGIRAPEFLEGRADEAYLGLLTLAMTRELTKRAKIMNFNSVDDAVRLLEKSRNIIVLTGAGISTSLGIPDFRSKETGLYAKLAELGLGVNDPQEVFSIDTFRENPKIFYTIAKDILPATKKFSPTHAFIAMLQNRGKLLTNYSQNIDNIEANAGILPEKLVQCHGSFATATCQTCKHHVPGSAIFDDIKAGIIPRCDKCNTVAKPKGNGSLKRKRSGNGAASKRSRRNFDDDDDDADGRYDIPEGGIMKPDITFFGEPLPGEFSKRLVKHDRNLVDLVIVIGTSLKVAPVSEVVPFLPTNIPQICITRDPIGHVNFDIDLLGDCDVVVTELCRRLGWELNHPMVSPNQKINVTLEHGYKSRHRFTPVQDPKQGPASIPREEEPQETQPEQQAKQRRNRNSGPRKSDSTR
ncbi:SIR2-domain-containing protein [Xylaria intraflava]|nr:SIR2-domain-containing protein [Xylaria intraflava]